MRKEIIKSVASLTIIAVVCTAILVVANYFLKTEARVGLDAELIAKLETMVGEGAYAEVDTTGITLDKEITNVYRKTDGDKSGTIIYYIYSPTTGGSSIGVLVAVDGGKVVATDYYEQVGILGSPWDKPINADNAATFFGKFKDTESGGVPSRSDFGSDLTSGATATADTIIRQVNMAVDNYKSNGDKLKNAPIKANTAVAVSVTSVEYYGEDEKPWLVRVQITSTDKSKFNISKAGDYTATVKLTSGGETHSASIGKLTANKDNTLATAIVRTDAPMGSYTLEITIKQKDKVVHTQTIQADFLLPEYVDIKEWLQLDSYDDIVSIANKDADGISVNIFEIAEQDYKIGSGTQTISGAFGTATVKVYMKIEADGKITEFKVINVEYDSQYNHVDTDSLNGKGIGDGDLAIESGSGATVTKNGAQAAVNAIAALFNETMGAGN